MKELKRLNTTKIMIGEKVGSFIFHATPAGIHYYTFSQVLNFRQLGRTCLYCGEDLCKGEDVIAVLTNCPQEVSYPVPRNFFIHKKCAGNLGKTIDELVREYQVMLMVVEQFGKRWKLSMDR